MSMDMSQFLQTFFEESFEGLEIMESGLLALDLGAENTEEINTIFRAAHSIKGGSATFGLSAVASFTHLMETLLDELRDGRRVATQPVVDLLLQAVDRLREMLSAAQSEEDIDEASVAAVEEQLKGVLEQGQEGGASQETSEAPETVSEAVGWRIHFKPHAHLYHTGNDPLRILAELEELGELEITANSDALPVFAELEPETSYLSWEIMLNSAVARETIDEVFAWVEDDCDLEIEALAAGSSVVTEPVAGDVSEARVVEQEVVKAPSVAAAKPAAGKDSGRSEKRSSGGDGGSIRVSIDKVDAVINLVSELVITQSMLSTLGENFEPDQLQSLRDGLAQLERNTRELQEDVMRMRMLPISFVFNRFPRLVHDVSAKLGKAVELVMTGEGTEVDKTVIEKLTDPLVHLVRNSLDHGIEPNTEARLEAGKPAVGKVTLNAYHKGGNIVIEVKDDGRGLNADKIRAKAIEKGLITDSSVLTDEQVYELILQPGFSTADTVSDLSGRGVGMDVVLKNIQSLGGNIEIHSTLGEGSCFTVRLPLTLAILDGQSVLVGEETYIVPLVSIVESIQIRKDMFNYVAGKGETFKLRGNYIPVIRMRDVFNLSCTGADNTTGLLVVVEAEGGQVGLLVDELLGQQQVVIKSMEDNYHKVAGISGATILGDGQVALILDIAGLIQIGRRSMTAARAASDNNAA